MTVTSAEAPAAMQPKFTSLPTRPESSTTIRAHSGQSHDPTHVLGRLLIAVATTSMSSQTVAVSSVT
jgi:hypothetical protein